MRSDAAAVTVANSIGLPAIASTYRGLPVVVEPETLAVFTPLWCHGGRRMVVTEGLQRSTDERLQRLFYTANRVVQRLRAVWVAVS